MATESDNSEPRSPRTDDDLRVLGQPDPPIPQNGELFGRVLGEIDACREMALASAPKGAA